jgi:hypothetical protein
MSDDKEHRRADETSEFSSSEDETRIRPKDGPSKGEPVSDRTEQMPSTPADAGGTQMLPAVDEDATMVTPRAPQSDATSALPPTSSSRTRTERYNRNTDIWADDGDPVWSGRAGVRPPRPGSGDDFTRTDWAAPADEPRGRWWMPIVVGIVALVLLGLLTWGIYLIAQSLNTDEDRTPAVTPSAEVPATTQPTTEPPSTAPTTTEQTSSPPAPPSNITIPALKGLSTDEARAALNRTGMSYRLRFVTIDSPPGTVIDSDPTEGQQVPAGTVITLIIAAEPTTSAAPTATVTTEPSQDED